MAKAQEERVLTWDELETGQEAAPTSIEVTSETIANYARSLQDDNPIFFDDQAARGQGLDGVIASPSMNFVYAPARRLDIMHALGFISPEEASVNPRSTPFVGADLHFQGVAVKPGDTITSTVKFANKWESKSGNRFVSIGVEARNQRGEKVVDYLYNIMWEFARGQKSRSGTAAPTPGQPEPEQAGGKVLDPSTVGFESVQVGDRLPTFQRVITQDLINGYSDLNNRGGPPNPTMLLHVDEAFAEATVFAGTTLQGPAAVGYLVLALQKGLGTRNVLNASVTERALEPVRPGDTITYTGRVLDKREEGGKRLVEVEVTGTNQLGQTTAAAKATVPL
ncbi:MAG: MaoC family dehydratase [Dehalococcoidia bacterium]